MARKTTPKSTKQNWVTTKVRKDLDDEIKKLLSKNTSKAKGLTNTSIFVNEAIMELIEKLNSPIMYHLGLYDDHVKIMDNGIGDSGKTISIFFKNNKVSCSHCNKDNCIHIHFVWELKNIRTILTNNGIIPPVQN